MIGHFYPSLKRNAGITQPFRAGWIVAFWNLGALALCTSYVTSGLR
jgi:hypothetical protein